MYIAKPIVLILVVLILLFIFCPGFIAIFFTPIFVLPFVGGVIGYFIGRHVTLKKISES